ncbi:LOW QUALITY PROTEIN: hypothetical protein Cgig2_009903 [Carnegiea gigantea]|uniref:DUF4283 domain-containing protein n=1 Tax=Carnegiea gigantea TaxID=171969 RepID=A0A9Q1K8E6_9CARY|nr:LOW QUALITY PROTEIN: hypothetical protein Cgig2_009903 [Carnegiea gigantea]
MDVEEAPAVVQTSPPLAKPPDPLDKMLPTIRKSMDVEPNSNPQHNLPKTSFCDIVTWVFSTAMNVVEQLQEALEDEIEVPDTPLKEDYDRILQGGPWFLFSHYLMLTPWKPNFHPSQNPFSSMIVWVRFPDPSVECFNKLALFDIAQLLGKPIKVDFATDLVSRARYARVCLEISLSKPLVDRVWVVNGWQQVEYENLDLLCLSCGIVGHVHTQLHVMAFAQ